MQKIMTMVVTVICFTLVTILSIIDAGKIELTYDLMDAKKSNYVIHTVPVKESIEAYNISNIINEQMYQIADEEVTIDDLRFIQFVDNEDTDVTDDQLEHILKTSEETGIDPYLITTVIWIESRGHSDVYAGDCRGYGGISSDAGNTIYEGYLGLGDYDHDMAFDPYINITLIGNTLKYLMTEPGYEFDIYGALQFYSGTKGEWGYINKVVRKLNDFGGPTLEEIEDNFNTSYEAIIQEE